MIDQLAEINEVLFKSYWEEKLNVENKPNYKRKSVEFTTCG